MSRPTDGETAAPADKKSAGAAASAARRAKAKTPAATLPIARVLPLLTPAHLDRDFDYLVPAEFDEIARPGVRVRVRFAGRLVDGYLLERLERSEHAGKLIALERVVSGERVLTPEILRLATTVAGRYAGTRADVLRLAVPPRHARTETGGAKTQSAGSAAETAGVEADSTPTPTPTPTPTSAPGAAAVAGTADTEAEAGSVPASPADSGAGKAGAGARADADAGTGVGANADADVDAARLPSPGFITVSGAEDIAADGDSASVTVPESVADAGVTEADAGSVPVSSLGTGPEVIDADAAGTSVPRSAEQSDVYDGGADAGSAPISMPETAADHAGADGEPASTRVPGATAATAATVVGAGVDEPRVARRPSETVRAEYRETVSAGEPAVDLARWARYVHGESFVGALAEGRGVRAAWQALPGEDWARRLAELAATVVRAGRGAIIMVPDQRDLDRVLAECVTLVGDRVVGLSAGLGPAARYRRWLAALRGQARLVVGTRSAVFAPVADLGLLAIWDDGDDTYAEPRAPYPHAREVAMLRAHETGAAFVAAGFARTAETQAAVDSGWAHDLIADRAVLRNAAPRISAPGDSDIALERDPIARAVRIPGAAFAAARAALKEGAAVLVQVPRRGYVPALACGKCRTPARCRRCNGPLALPEGGSGGVAHSPACRWCGISETAYRCPVCAARALRAVVIGAARTAEELGRAFPGVPIRGSSAGSMLDTVEPGPQVVVATVGAEPVLRGGYGVALLLDGWALLGRADLRAAEDALRRWLNAAALVRAHGQVLVMAEPALPTVQALVRWDPVGHARSEVAARSEVGFPPAVRLAVVDGASDAIADLLAATTLPAGVEVLGPVPLPPGARAPFSGDSTAEVERLLLRVDRRDGAALSRALVAAQAVRSTHRSDAPLRVQIDPVDIG